MTISKEDLPTLVEQHKLWLRGEGGIHADLSGADLRHADLSGAILRHADLRHAILSGADLRHAILSGADLSGAILSGAILSGATLSGAILSGAILRHADLRHADLRHAILSGADLSGALGIVSFGPVGYDRRIGFAVRHGEVAMVKLGCFWGTQEEALSAIEKKYGATSTYADLVIAACRCVLEQSK